MRGECEDSTVSAQTPAREADGITRPLCEWGLRTRGNVPTSRHETETRTCVPNPTLGHFAIEVEFQSSTPTFQRGKSRPKGMERVKQVYTMVNSRAGVSTPCAEV